MERERKTVRKEERVVERGKERERNRESILQLSLYVMSFLLFPQVQGELPGVITVELLNHWDTDADTAAETSHIVHKTPYPYRQNANTHFQDTMTDR